MLFLSKFSIFLLYRRFGFFFGKEDLLDISTTEKFKFQRMKRETFTSCGILTKRVLLRLQGSRSFHNVCLQAIYLTKRETGI